MSDIKLTDYLPEITDISSEALKDASDRIKTYLASEFEDAVDMSPNSVFGDLVLNPVAHLIVGFEIAANRLFSDIDLANISEGTVYNCDFVKKYLENFGLHQRLTFPTTGVVRMTFSAPGSYVLDAQSTIVFSLDGEDFTFEFSEVDDFVEITSTMNDDPETPDKRRLIKISENEYIVNMPVTGTAGTSVLKGTVASSNISIPHLKRIESVMDFDPGVLPENVMELANKAQRTYYASSLTTRTGCLSFLIQTFPELQGASPVINGDAEMIRGTTNILGISEGVMDIHVKSRKTFITEFLTQRFAYSPSQGVWHGKITAESGPPAHISRISRTDGDTVAYDVYGKASDLTKYPVLSAAYSLEETLGIQSSTVPIVSDIPASIDFEQKSSPALRAITISGVYEGYVFSDQYSRVVKLSGNSFDGTTLLCNLVDVSTNEYIQTSFEETFVGSKVYRLQPDEDYNKFLKGVVIDIEFLTAVPIEDQIDLFINDSPERFTATAKNGEFTIEYEYDPNLVSINTLVNNSDVKPINSDLLIRNFLTCKVSNITITYRAKIGRYVDLESIKTEIVSYVNSLSYPNLYEEHSIAEIVLYYGADGIRSVEQSGQFFRTQANRYLVDNCDAPDEQGDCFEEVLNPMTTTLLPSDNMPGIGERNIHYILNSEDIVFNEISF